MPNFEVAAGRIEAYTGAYDAVFIHPPILDEKDVRNIKKAVHPDPDLLIINGQSDCTEVAFGSSKPPLSREQMLERVVRHLSANDANSVRVVEGVVKVSVFDDDPADVYSRFENLAQKAA